MADRNAARRYRAISSVTVDIDALRASAKGLRAGRVVRPVAATQTIQAHAEAVGRGEPSTSPFKVRGYSKA
jgi:hypothetical protein